MIQKNIIVTGAAGNLGSATVQKFIKEGHSVSAILSHGKKNMEQHNLFSYQADLANEIESKSVVENIITNHKNVYAAVLTVGGFSMGSIENTSTDDVQKMIALNFNTAYNVVRPVLNHLKKQNGGRIVLIGSKPALESSAGVNSIAYSLSKTLIFKLADLINTETDKENIKASVIVPNIIDTPVNRKDMPNADFSKWRTPQDIANSIYDFVIGNRSEEIIKLY